MRSRIKPLRGTNKDALFVTSEPSGKMQFDTIYGSDNIIMNKKVPFKYQVVKPYTSLVTDIHTNLPVVIKPKDMDDITVYPPSTGEILAKVSESLWADKLDSLFQDADVYANNGATENALRYGEVLGYVTLLEGGDTIKMIRNVFLRLFKAVLDVYKSAKKLNVVATMDTLSDIWLEARYGWRPLIGELGSLHELMTHVRKDGVKSAYGTSEVRELPTSPIEIATVDILTKQGQTFTYKVSFKPGKAFSKVGYNFLNTDSSRNDDWLALLGLDLESLPRTVWDLIPFSFVVDMFLNVGSILQVQNSSEQVSSFNHYKSHFTEGNILLECVAISTEVPGRPIDWSAHFGRYPKIKLRSRPIHPLRPKNPAELVMKILDRGPHSSNVGFYPKKDIYNGFLSFGSTWERIETGNPGPPFSDLRFEDLKVLFSKNQPGSQVWSIHDLSNRWSIFLPSAFAEILQYFDFQDMTDDQCAQFVQDILYPGSLRQFSALQSYFATSGTSWGSPSINQMVTKPLSNEIKKALQLWPNPFVTVHDSYSFVTHVAPLSLGYEPERRITLDADLSDLTYEVSSKIFTRQTTDGVYHLFTKDVDLSPGQFADLGALALTLTKRFRK